MSLRMIHLKTKFFSSCDPMKLDKLSDSKYNGGTDVGWTFFFPIPTGRNQKEERGKLVLSRLET